MKIQVIGTCVSVAHSLKELCNKYKDAPITIVAICSETTAISASLAGIQKLLQERDLRPEFAGALDTSLTGCAVLFSCLHEEMQRITKGSIQPREFAWKEKMRLVWNQDRLQELLNGLHGQQLAINTITNLLQM